MNRAMHLSAVVVLLAAGTILSVFAQTPASNMQRTQSPAVSQMSTSRMSSSPMSVSDMEGHLNSTMSQMTSMTPGMQGYPQMQLLMDRMKSLGADLNLLLNRIQAIMADKTMSQDKLKMQHVQNISRQIQTMIQSVDGVVGEMDLMQKNK